MPLAGQIIRAADFDGYASVSDTTDETNFNSTVYILGGVTVGVSFRAPTSGTVQVWWSARGALNSATAQRILVSAEVRAGSAIGSGTQVSAASDGSSVEWGQTAGDRLQASQQRWVSGLTAGAIYNVSLWHRNAVTVASAGTLFDRAITVSPRI